MTKTKDTLKDHQKVILIGDGAVGSSSPSLLSLKISPKKSASSTLIRKKQKVTLWT